MKQRNRFNAIRCLVSVGLLSGWLASAGSAERIPNKNNYVTASFDSTVQNGITQSILTLTGDDGDNSVTVLWRAGSVTVTAGGQTRIGNSSSSVAAVTFHTGTSFNLTGNLNGGNDYLSISTIQAPNMTLNLGSGNDQAKLLYCTVGTLTVNGGPGTNSLARVGSKATNSAVTNIQVYAPPN